MRKSEQVKAELINLLMEAIEVCKFQDGDIIQPEVEKRLIDVIKLQFETYLDKYKELIILERKLQ